MEKVGGKRWGDDWIRLLKALLEILMEKVINLVVWKVADPGSNCYNSNCTGMGKMAWLGKLEWIFGSWLTIFIEVGTVPVDFMKGLDVIFIISAQLSYTKIETCGLYHKEQLLALWPSEAGWPKSTLFWVVCSRMHQLLPCWPSLGSSCKAATI